MKALFEDERGISMTEGVIVVPFFILIWTGLIAVHHLYSGRLEAQLESAANAMATASYGCSEKNVVDLTEAAGQNPEIADEADDWLSSLSGDSPFAWSHAVVTATVDVDHIPRTLGGPVMQVSGRQRYLCNMEPVDSLTDLIVDLVNSLLGLD
jgi:Flp pilus assembly protein TadG